MIWKFVWRYRGLQRNGRTINRSEKSKWGIKSIDMHVSHMTRKSYAMLGNEFLRLLSYDYRKNCVQSMNESIISREIEIGQWSFFFLSLFFSLSLFFKNANIVSRNEANSLKNDKRVRGRRSWPIILMKNIYMYLWTHWKMDSRWRIGKHAARSWLNDRS